MRGEGPRSLLPVVPLTTFDRVSFGFIPAIADTLLTNGLLGAGESSILLGLVVSVGLSRLSCERQHCSGASCTAWVHRNGHSSVASARATFEAKKFIEVHS